MAAQTSYCKLFGPAPTTLGLPNNHSGMSPLGPPSFRGSQSTAQDAIRQRVEAYQKRHLVGFTTQMLVDLDAVTNRELKPNDIVTVLDPILAKNRWERLPPAYVKNLTPNHIPRLSDPWGVEINSVWNAIYPALCLASVMLKHIYKHPWFDALIMGNTVPVPHNRLDGATLLSMVTKPRDDLRCIKLRPPGPRTDCEAHRSVLFTANLDPFLELGFMDGNVNPRTGKKTGGFMSGMTSRADRKNIRLYIAKQEVWPLLRTDLSSSQRSATQLVVVQTLIHEVIHAYNMANNIHHFDMKNIPTCYITEPYFENEQVNELGHSAENSIFGGIVRDFSLQPYGKPSLGNFHMSWPDRSIESNDPKLINPHAWTWKVFSPIPVSYYEMIQSDAFWRVHFRSFGIIRADKSPVASVMNTSIKAGSPWSIQPTLAYWPPNNREIENQIGMTPDERNHHNSKMKTPKRNTFVALLRSRDDAVATVVDCSNRCDSLKEGPDTAMYIKELKNLYERLVVLVDKTVACITALKDMEEGGERRIDQRNNILDFEHKLRRLIRYFEKCDDVDLEEKLSNLVIKLESSTVGLMLRPLEIGVYGGWAPLVAEQEQTKLLDTASKGYYRGNIEESQRACVTLMASLGATIPQRSHAGLLFARAAVAPIEERRAELDKAEKTMRKLLAGGGSSQEGKLADFEKELAAVRKQVDDEEGGEGG